MAQPLDFQSIIMKLQQFWADQRLPHLAAILLAGRRGHDEPGYIFTRAGPGALECGLCGTIHPPG